MKQGASKADKDLQNMSVLYSRIILNKSMIAHLIRKFNATGPCPDPDESSYTFTFPVSMRTDFLLHCSLRVDLPNRPLTSDFNFVCIVYPPRVVNNSIQLFIIYVPSQQLRGLDTAQCRYKLLHYGQTQHKVKDYLKVSHQPPSGSTAHCGPWPPIEGKHWRKIT
jgi:hypothetical protein